jgi:hypothetical protein
MEVLSNTYVYTGTLFITECRLGFATSAISSLYCTSTDLVLDVKNFIADVCLTLWPEYFEVSCTICTWRLFFEKIAGSDGRVQLKVGDRHIDHSSKAWHTEIPDLVPGTARW